MRSSGAVFTLVRVGNSDSTRPFEEMQSDNRSVTKIELTNNNATKEQFNDQQKPESSGQQHHSPGVDRKSLEELLYRLTARPQAMRTPTFGFARRSRQVPTLFHWAAGWPLQNPVKRSTFLVQRRSSYCPDHRAPVELPHQPRGQCLMEAQ